MSPKRCKLQIYLQWNTNRKSHMAYQMEATSVTLSDLKVIQRLQAFSNSICRTYEYVQHFTRLQLTVVSLCSHGSSALAELLGYNTEGDVGIYNAERYRIPTIEYRKYRESVPYFASGLSTLHGHIKLISTRKVIRIFRNDAMWHSNQLKCRPTTG